jgi:hypothetical protein
MSVDRVRRQKGTEMNANAHQGGPRQAGRAANNDGTLRVDLEASARALIAADNAYVHEAMNSVDWERRGFLQRLTRRAR